MPDESDAPREFVFQTSDQAGGAAQHRQYNQYNAERNTNAPGAQGQPGQIRTQNPPLRYTDFSAQQQPLAPDFPGFGFTQRPTLMSGWDWTNSIDFSEVNQYEPQGELIQELRNQSIPNNDFSVPLPVANAESTFQTSQHLRGTNPTPPAVQTQNSLPLPPPPRPAQQRPIVQTSMKRKVDSEPSSAVSQSTGALLDNPSKRQNRSRQSSDASITSPVIAASADARSTHMSRLATTPAANEAASANTSQEDNSSERRKEQSKGTGPQGRVIDVSRPRRVVETTSGLDMLPAGKVFPIQIGSELFRLSGASLSSDAPSYFSHYFGQQLHENGGRAGDVKTLYIDRDPNTFRDIALHLQGYHITPKDGEHFVKLFADSQFYSLPRLTKQLFSTDIFVRIGGTPFQIPRDLFSGPGDSPNYFSLGFAQFFSTPSEVFPGLDRSALLRPPMISPPSVPNRNGETFNELIQILKGYNVDIRDSNHRSRLLRDARYFHLKGLEQRLIPHQISYNLKRQQHEILLRLEDIRQSGVSFSPDAQPPDSESGSTVIAAGGGSSGIGVSPGPFANNNNNNSSKAPSPSHSSTSTSTTPTQLFRAGYVSYARPYTDDHATPKTLILEISAAETTTLYLPPHPPSSESFTTTSLPLRATFHNATLARITSLFSVIASKMGLPATQPLGLMYLQSGAGVAAQPVSPANSGVSERRVRVRVSSECALEIDGRAAEVRVHEESGKVGVRILGSGEWVWGGGRRDVVGEGDDGDEEEEEMEWVVKRAHWRVRVEPVESSDIAEARKMQVVLCGVKIEAFSQERTRNVQREFLS